MRQLLLAVLALSLFSACSPAATPTPTPAPAQPDWFTFNLTDVSTGQNFTMHDFAGKVVLVETMAEWCPTCREQQTEIQKLHGLLSNPDDLVSVSLDVDSNEDSASLKDYVSALGYNWRFAVASLEVERALGNLYSAEYLNPPLAPMLIIDRQGRVYGLAYGVKNAESLKKTLDQYLTP